MSSFLENPNWDPRGGRGGNCKSWERGLPVQDELTPVDQPLITPILADAFGITEPSMHAPGSRDSMYPPSAAHHQHHLYQQPPMNLNNIDRNFLLAYSQYDNQPRSMKYPPAMPPTIPQQQQHHNSYPYHALPLPNERDALLGHGHHTQHAQHMPQNHQQMPPHGFPGVPPDRGDPYPHHPGHSARQPGLPINSGHPRLTSGHHPPPPHHGHAARSGYMQEQHPHDGNVVGKKRERPSDDVQPFSSEEDGVGAKAVKRPRLVWTPQLHKRFVDAVSHLGIKNSVPKTIMQLMNVEGLTRENVASHLQKYRLYLKRITQSVPDPNVSLTDMNLTETPPTTDIAEGNNNTAAQAGSPLLPGPGSGPDTVPPSSQPNRNSEDAAQHYPGPGGGLQET